MLALWSFYLRIWECSGCMIYKHSCHKMLFKYNVMNKFIVLVAQLSSDSPRSRVKIWLILSRHAHGNMWLLVVHHNMCCRMAETIHLLSGVRMVKDINSHGHVIFVVICNFRVPIFVIVLIQKWIIHLNATRLH